jgi:hypothetical protein
MILCICRHALRVIVNHECTEADGPTCKGGESKQSADKKSRFWMETRLE